MIYKLIMLYLANRGDILDFKGRKLPGAFAITRETVLPTGRNCNYQWSR